MKARTKSTLLLVATLVVGGLVGAVSTGAIVNHRLEELRTMRNPKGFSDKLEHVIEPTDDAQRAQIHAVLERSEARFSTAGHTCGGLFRTAADSMRTELDPLLTPAQQTRLDEWLAKDRRSQRERRGRRGKSSKHDNKPR